MDFSRQLQSLQQSANHAASSSDGGDEGGRNRHQRRRPRDNEGYDSNGRNSNNNHESYNGQHKRQRRDDRGGGGPWDSRSHGYHQERHYNSHNSREMSLRRALESIPLPRSLPTNIATNSIVHSVEGGQTRRRRHVALLFLTIDDLPHEHIWRAWINHQNNNSNENDDMLVSVLVHAKFPHLVQSPWLKSRLLLEPATPGRGRNSFGDPKFHSHRPEWGSVQITRGMIDLVGDALRIGIPDRMREEHRTDPRYSLDRFLATEYATTQKAEIHTTTTSSTSTSTSREMDMSFAVPPVDRFIFVSETCLPVTTLQEAEVALFGKTDDLHSSSIVKDQQDTEEREVQANKDESEIVSEGNAVAVSVKDSAVDTEETSAHTNDDVAIATTTAIDGEDYEKSWLFALNTPNNGYAKQLQWDKIDSAVQPKHIWKSDQWIVLTRPHAEAVLGIERYLPRGNNNNDFWRCFGRVKASDEMYFPTCLSLLHILGTNNDNSSEQKEGGDRSIGSQILQRRVTYSDWSMGAKNPASFCSKGIRDLKDVATIARKQGCLFARKFSPEQEMEGAAAAVSQSVSSRSTKTDGNMADPEVMSVKDWLGVIQGLQNSFCT